MCKRIPNCIVGAQGKLMKARDERLSVMNEVCFFYLFLITKLETSNSQLLGSIRTLKVWHFV